MGLLQLRKALSVVDGVLRVCGASARLEPGDVLTLSVLAESPGCRAADVGRRTGRARQHVQRTLDRLARRGLVTPLPRAGWNPCLLWFLTAEGGRHWALTSRRLAGWEAHLDQRLDFPHLTDLADEALQACLARTRSNGYTEAIGNPREALADPLWNSLEADLPFQQRLVEGAKGFSAPPPITDDEVEVAAQPALLDEWEPHVAPPPPPRAHRPSASAPRAPVCSTPPRTPAPLAPPPEPEDPLRYPGIDPPADAWEAERRRLWGYDRPEPDD